MTFSNTQHEGVYEACNRALQGQRLHRKLPASNQARLDFTSNDYLGLSRHPAVIDAACEYTRRYGAGATGSRLLSGNLPCFAELETAIAEAKGTEAALVFNAGYQANATVLAALTSPTVWQSEPQLFTDRLNHASLHHACRLNGLRQIRYRHNDLAHLRDCLEKNAVADRPRFIVAETVFGMDGDCVDMAALTALADEFGAFLYLDEAHATGLYGQHGYGLSSGWWRPAGTTAHRGVAMGTFSKALGGQGAYIACSAAVRDFLINQCTGFIYSTAPAPASIGAALAAWRLVPQMNATRAAVFAKADALRAACQTLGLNTGPSTGHIVPLIVGAVDAAEALRDHLQTAGFSGSLIRPPTVPPHTARIRIAIGAQHGAHDIAHLIESLRDWARNA
ncbi:MAG: aminotransferase class I/II-fold pyridoxal phosphate-dependent enzyme [Burkholderiaceae bacterium]